MLHKFERYISKNTPKNALAIVERKAEMVPYDYKGKPATGNALYSWGGWQQRQRVEPRKYNLIDNKERIGKVIRQHIGPQSTGWIVTNQDERMSIRKAFAYQAEINHMQSTPYIRRGTWHLTIENIGFYRSHAMLWGRCSEDPFRAWGNRYEMTYGDMSAAVSSARKFGYEVDLVYPHERYHTQKAYADNFSFVKEAITDIEDEEDLVYNIMQRLV
jgi:hypothetical protein